MSFQGDIQKADPGSIIEMFVLETPDGNTHYITAITGGVTFDTNTYATFPIEASGFKRTSQGSIPQPSISLADISGYFSGLINAADTKDLLGSKVTRIRTFRKHLDDGSDPDTSARFPNEVYYIEKKTGQTRYGISWSLASKMDLFGTKLPRRLILKNLCTHTYRMYTGSSFTYGTCPYAGTAYFDKEGTPVTISNDSCGKRVTDCRLRFPEPANLPTRAFLGVYRVRN